MPRTTRLGLQSQRRASEDVAPQSADEIGHEDDDAQEQQSHPEPQPEVTSTAVDQPPAPEITSGDQATPGEPNPPAAATDNSN
jgi:hypothetical protein